MTRMPVVNRLECVSCGVCIDMAPAVFRFGPLGKSEVFDPHGATDEEIRRAIEQCPVECIRWEEVA